MKKIIITCIAALFCALSNAQGVQASRLSEVQALYIYNFARNIGWPTEDNKSELVITVIGDKMLASELTEMAQSKLVGNRKVVVKDIRNVSELGESDLVFVGISRTGQFGSLVSALNGKKTLIISGKEDMCSKGACIAFKVEEGKLVYQISDKNIKSMGLAVSQHLLKLGRTVN